MRQPAVTADRIDYWIRRGVTPCFPQSNVNPARDRRAALMVIGRLLRDQYDALATPVPPHLAALVERLKNAEIGETSSYSELRGLRSDPSQHRSRSARGLPTSSSFP
jgi:hypothetical protein